MSDKRHWLSRQELGLPEVFAKDRTASDSAKVHR